MTRIGVETWRVYSSAVVSVATGSVRRIVQSMLAICFAVTTAIGCHADHPSRSEAPLPVEVTALEYAADSSSTTFSANFHPYAGVNAAFRVAGYVDSIPQIRGADGRMPSLHGGDSIRRGEVLARIRSEEYLHRVRQS